MRRVGGLRVVAVAVAIGLVVACSSSSGGNGAAVGTVASYAPGSANLGTVPTEPPNILFVLTDDMDLAEVQYMPHLKELLIDQGMSFGNYFDNVTVCCPARATLLRGQYAQNTGIFSNTGHNGGFQTAYHLGIEKETLATALQDVGYRTGLFGKYLNGYPYEATNTYIPPGWDTWSSSPIGEAYTEYNYTLNQDGKLVPYGKDPADYGTSVYLKQADDFMTKAAKDHKPFFSYLPVYAPHQPATPAPPDQKLFPDAMAPRTPSFNEDDVSDKPRFLQVAPTLGKLQTDFIDDLFRRRIRSLQSVDRGIADLVAGLKRRGQFNNTYIVFSSDNGFHLGQHRMAAGKESAYEEDIHLPLIIRGPGVPAGSTVDAMVGDTDVAPTLAELGGTHLAFDPDGRSLVPYLRSQPPTTSRNSFLLGHWNPDQSATPPVTTPNGPQLEPADPDQAGVPTGGAKSGTTSTTQYQSTTDNGFILTIPNFQGIRTRTSTYVEYETGERELYDLTKDPDELTNIVTTADPGLLDALHHRLEELKTCKADTCRTAEDAPIP